MDRRPAHGNAGQASAATLKAGIDEGGCLLVRDQVGPERVAELVDGIERAFTARDQPRRIASPAGSSRWRSAAAPTTSRASASG